jgi:two-component system NtrC family sensor kinase
VINEKAGLLSDLLERETDFAQKDFFFDQIKAIIAAVTRCRDITRRMLGFARRMDVKIEYLDVNAMIDETLLFLEKEAMHRKVEIVRDMARDMPSIASDRGQLQQVFLNVLNNALAAVSEGGRIVIRTAVADEERICVSFTDNGCGMSEETLQHIFEPFFTTKKGEGTGLGMSIIYGIVKRHGGDIAVESRLGRGSTITIVLPVRQPRAGN